MAPALKQISSEDDPTSAEAEIVLKKDFALPVELSVDVPQPPEFVSDNSSSQNHPCLAVSVVQAAVACTGAAQQASSSHLQLQAWLLHPKFVAELLHLYLSCP